MRKWLAAGAAVCLLCLCTGCGMGLEQALIWKLGNRAEASGKSSLSQENFLEDVLERFLPAGGESREVRQTCENLFEAYQSGNEQALAQVFDLSEEEADFGELQTAIAKHLTVKTKRPETEEDTGRMQAVITTVDMDAVLQMLPEDTDSVEAARASLLEILEREDLPEKEFEVELLLKKKDGEWIVELTPELSNALLGGYPAVLETVMEEAGL